MKPPFLPVPRLRFALLACTPSVLVPRIRLVLLACIAIAWSTTTHAQTSPYDSTTQAPPKPKPDPTKQAARQLKNLEQQLHLTQDQVLQLQVILINRNVSIDSLRNNPSADPRTQTRARRQINQMAELQINALLTDEQKTRYQQWKQQQRDRAMERRLDSGSVPQ